MSGGVDSSVAALILKRKGYDVIGVTMRLWTVDRHDLPQAKRRCCSVEDVDYARRACQIIGVPHYYLNLEREFQEHVVDYFCREYSRGRTPHPCIACNDRIKFNHLMRRAAVMDADYLATGHYARISPNGSGLRLLKSVDGKKDQSYALFTLGQCELDRLLLPVGEHSKDGIRRMAAEAGLPTARTPESQEICFIPDGDYRSFLSKRREPKPGQIVDTGGTILGEHPGIHLFTVGQRKGHGLDGNTGSPRYVVSIDARTNRVVLGPEENLYRRTVWASGVSFVTGNPPVRPMKVTAKIRYNSPESPATLVHHGSHAEVRFHEPQRAVTPGQAVVFYDGEEVVGGGTIEPEAPAL